MDERRAEFHEESLTTVKMNNETSLPQSGLDERRPDQWQRISQPAWRALKKSIVAAGASGAISGPTAERLINRFHLKDV